MPIYFVRHGQTDWNLEKRWQSTTDVPLNGTGLKQARNIRDFFQSKNVEFSAAWASPLQRARTTADIILEGFALKAIPEPAIVELDIGDFEGRLERELQQELGQEYTEWRESCFFTARPGGESIEQVKSRVSPFMTAVLPEARSANVLIVAHQAVNMAMKAILAGAESGPGLKEFAQLNDEIDIWDVVLGKRMNLVCCSPGQ